MLFVASAFYSNPTPILLPSKDIQWVDMNQAMEQIRKGNKKKLFFNIYKKKCGYCLKMNESTFTDPVIIDYINKNFYAIQLDLQEDSAIEFNGKTYKSTKKDGQSYHELAAHLTMGSLSAPTSVFVDEDLNVLQPLPGFKDPITFEVIMTYYGENHYTNTPWSMYKESYVPLAKKNTLSDED